MVDATRRRLGGLKAAPDSAQSDNDSTLLPSGAASFDSGALPHPRRPAPTDEGEGKATKWESLAYVLLAGGLVYWLDVPHALVFHPLRWELPFYLALLTAVLFAGTFAYLHGYYRHVRKMEFRAEQWTVLAPRAVPFATVCMLLTTLLATVAYWDVWGWKTPFVLYSLLMGTLASMNLVGL